MFRPTFTMRALPVAALACAWLAGCGGGSGGDAVSSGADLPRGTLISAVKTGTVTKAAADGYLAANPEEQSLVQEAAACDVDVYRLIYATESPGGDHVEDSMGLQVPTNCAGPYPMLLLNHGTTILREATNSDASGETPVVPYFSAQGYVVVVPDYSGYSGSTLDYHPYQVAENGAVVTIDAVRAARQWLASASVSTSGKFFIFGSSQGGGVTMATQRAMERDYGSEFSITATVPTSGSYDLETTMLDKVTEPIEDNPAESAHSTLLITAYERTYGDIYGETTDVFQLPWADNVTGLLPGSLSAGQLVDQGILPATTHGPGGLLTDAWIADFVANPNNRMRVRLRENSLIDWTPASPMALCGSADDPAVEFKNTLTAQAAFASRGVAVPVEDVSVDPEYAAFIAARTVKGQGPDSGDPYHSDVVRPACQSYARIHVFDPLR